MKIAVPKESETFECRVALTPEVSKKLIELGHQVILQKGAGVAAGIADADYEAVGVKLAKSTENLYEGAHVIARVSPPSIAEVGRLPKGSILIGLLKPYENEKLVKELAKKKITTFALEFVPRISRAQSMDVLSSQSNLAGYKAVVDAAAVFGRALPMMMTAAGMIPPARVLILGAGVAGLQAIATARRLGAIVSAFDVRPAVKEQVESLGAAFVEVESGESGEGTGGYAKEMSADYKKRQQAKLEEVMRQQDIVISTAQIPGKEAPVLISEKMVKEMKAGSIIVDLAIESGGNCAVSEIGKMVVKHGVNIMGYPNFPSRIPYDASHVYARNVLNFLKLLLGSDGKTLGIDWNDEIIKGAALCHEGNVVHPAFNAPVKKEPAKKEKEKK